MPDGVLAALTTVIIIQAAVIGWLAFQLLAARRGIRGRDLIRERTGPGQPGPAGETEDGFGRAVADSGRTQENEQGGDTARVWVKDNALVGREENLHGDAFYGNEEAYEREDYIGRVSRGAELELIDTNVETNEFDIDIIKVKVLSNEWEAEVGRVGWVGLDDTSFRGHFNPETRSIE